MSFQMSRRKSLIGGFLALLLLFGGPANAGSEEGANAFLRSLADQAARSLTDADIPRPERIKLFRTMFRKTSLCDLSVSSSLAATGVAPAMKSGRNTWFYLRT